MRPFVFALLVPSLALAATYEVPLDNVDDEDDIIDLEEKGDISTETADILYDMITEGVDLNSASRDELFDLPGLSYADVDAIILYRKNKGRIEDPTELVGGGSITDQQLVLIAPFIKLTSGPVKLPFSGRLRLRTGVSSGDFAVPGRLLPPPGFLNGTVGLPWNLSVGFLANLTRLQPGAVFYDPVNGLSSHPYQYRATLPVGYLQWKTGNRRIVVGSYNIGFAERVTLDTTRRRQPAGITVNSVPLINRELASLCKTTPELDCTSGMDPMGRPFNNYVLDDWSIRTNLRGVAGSIEDLELGEHSKLSLYGFLSYQSRDLYQYETFDKGVCEDPRDESQQCKAPPFSLSSNQARLKFNTLPNLYDELVGGAHVDFKPTERYRIGLTGYGANTFWGVPAAEPSWPGSFASHFNDPGPVRLQPQEWSSSPWGGPFGAIGLDGKAQFGPFGLFLEGARSFDSIRAGPDPMLQPAGGGGFAVEQRTLYNPKRTFLELSLRFYDDKFANSLGRPIAAPDQVDGAAARNEAGVRLKYFGKVGYDLELRATADFWVLPFRSNPRLNDAGTANFYGMLRVDYEGYRAIAPALWVDVRNKNLGSSEHGITTCDKGELLVSAVTGEPVPCQGDSYKITGRLDFRPFGKKLSGYVQGAFTWKDDQKYKNDFMTTASIALEVRSQPVDWLQLKLRTRYFNEDTVTSDYLEESVFTYIQATFLLGKAFKGSLRYDLNVYVDKRTSTAIRVPNPEHRVYLDLRTGF